MLSLLTGKWARYLIGAGVLVAIVVAIRTDAAKDARDQILSEIKDARIENLENERERDEAVENLDSDGVLDAFGDWLHGRPDAD